VRGQAVNGPPRPRCRFPQHEPHRNDCHICRHVARRLTGNEYADGWFGTGDTTEPSSIRPAGRMLSKEDKEEGR
jgi:hypothetical protein